MAGKWHTRALGDLTVNHDSKRKPVKEADRRPGPYPYYGASGIVDYVDEYLIDGDYLLIAEDGENLRTRQTPIAFMARGKYWVNNHAHIVTGNDMADTLFLMYAVQAADISGYLTGAVMPKLTQGNLNKIQISCPSLDEQRAIAHILGTLDDKIELNRRMNETLEAIARAIFKSWFVDFDPVRAKASGEPPKSICQRLGLTPDRLALFPDRLVDSELGEIPEGWEWSSVGEEVSIFGGGTPSTANPEFWNGEYAWVTPKDLSGAPAKVLVGSERKITQAGVKKISSGQLPIGTVLLSSRAPIGYLSLAMIPVSINQGFIAMVCDKRLPNTYVLQWAIENLDAIKQRGSGTTFAEISKTNFRPMAVLVPDEHVLKAFHQHAIPLYEQITEKVRESETLGAVRDTLLPKLLSGELRVPEIESSLESMT